MPRDDVRLLDQVGVEDGPRLSGPLLQLGQLVDQEDSGALRFSARLHDPVEVQLVAFGGPNMGKRFA